MSEQSLAQAPHANGHHPKRAVLYSRVSTRQQAEVDNFSIPQQLHALREYCGREGFKVIEEVTDPGYSGASLERPGMDRVRDLVGTGGVDVVLAQDRDRFAREPAYLYLLREECARHGTDLRALNDRGDDTPEGQLTDVIMDQLAKFERSKFTERSRRGKVQRAREGKVVPTHTPDYGFSYSEDRTGYVVVEVEMEIVRRIFDMIAGGTTIQAVKRTLDRQGVTPPAKGMYWAKKTIREIVLDDVYRPHDKDVIAALVREGLMTADVAARLDPEKSYGIWFYNTRRYTRSQVAETGPDGKRVYRHRRHSEARPRSQWVAVPVPTSGVPLDQVEVARSRIKDNRRPSSAGTRVWELSGGVIRCGSCGNAMSTTRQRGTPDGSYLNYYRCATCFNHGPDACPRRRGLRAEEVEARVWATVKAPSTKRACVELIRTHFDQASDYLRRFSTDLTRHKSVAETLARLDDKRSAHLDQQAEGLITMEELKEKLADLEVRREAAESELASLTDTKGKLTRLLSVRDTLLENTRNGYLRADGREERQALYRKMGLRVKVDENDNLDISWLLPMGDVPLTNSVCEPEPARVKRARMPHHSGSV